MASLTLVKKCQKPGLEKEKKKKDEVWGSEEEGSQSQVDKLIQTTKRKVQVRLGVTDQVHQNHVFANPANTANEFVRYSGKEKPEDLSAIKEQGKQQEKTRTHH